MVRTVVALWCLTLVACRWPLATSAPSTPIHVTANIAFDAAKRQMNLRLSTPASQRGVLALPASWDQAVVTFSSPSALVAPVTLTIPKSSFTENAAAVPPNFEFPGSATSTPPMPALRPATDYTVGVVLKNAGIDQATGSLAAQTLNAGGNLLTVTLALLAPMLTDLHPHVSPGGSTVHLEGIDFSSSATVNFPGGASATATVLGGNRLSAVVPAGATAGDLTVTTGGRTTNALPFRRSPFGLHIRRFYSRYEQEDAARQTAALVLGRRAPMVHRIGKYVYVLGGSNGSNTNAVASVERAEVEADGTLRGFSTVGGVTLATARWVAASAVVGQYLYVVGGYDGTSSLGSVERATINADGTLGSFSVVSGVSLATARAHFGSAVIGRYLYVFGGNGPAGVLASVERAPINTDGTLGTFSTVSGVTLTSTRNAFGLAVVGNAIYVVGGTPDGASANAVTTVERSTINADGTIGTFALVSGVNMNVGRDSFVLTRVGDFLFAMGGSGPTAGAQTMERATINADGSLTTFAALTSARFIEPRDGARVVVAGNYMYAIGGHTYTPMIERTTIHNGNTIGTFSALGGSSLVTARGRHTSAVIGPYLYVVGGRDGTGALGSVERAPVAPDGSLGAFGTVAGVSLVTPRSLHASAVIGNYLYVIGGYSGTAGLASVERAVINADGTIGPFSTVSGVALVQSRWAPGVSVIGNRLYIIGGGTDGINGLTSVEAATINADGTIGNFATVTGSPLTTGRQSPNCAVIGTYFYVYAGSNGSATPYADVERAVINADGTLGAFSSVGTMATAREAPVSVIVGEYLYILGGYNAGRLASVERAQIFDDHTLGTFSIVSGVTLASGRDYPTLVRAGSSVYVLGGYDGSGAVTGSVERAFLQ